MSARRGATRARNALVVTDHAVRRYLERVDSGEQYPATSIRETIRRSVDDLRGLYDGARVRSSDATFVVRRVGNVFAIVTVYGGTEL